MPNGKSLVVHAERKVATRFYSFLITNSWESCCWSSCLRFFKPLENTRTDNCHPLSITLSHTRRRYIDKPESIYAGHRAGRNGSGRIPTGGGLAASVSSVTILRPAVIFPGNVNTPSLVGRFNEMLNPILPGSLQTVSSVQIAQCMVEQMQQQVAGDWRGVKVIAGGQAIKDALVVPQ
jgi:hypothetical protein